MKIWSTQGGYAITLGWLLALVVLIIDIVFMAVGSIDLKVGLLIGGVALARLL
jgi:uncharacterized membrane protein YccF (DUF307 family)